MPAKKIKLQRPRNEAERAAAEKGMQKTYGKYSTYTHPDDMEAKVQARMNRMFSENTQKAAKAMVAAKKSATTPTKNNPEELNRLDVPAIIKRIRKSK